VTSAESKSWQAQYRDERKVEARVTQSQITQDKGCYEQLWRGLCGKVAE